MRAFASALPGVVTLEPKVFGDDRGFFFESYNKRAFREATGLDVEFVQDNHSRSAGNVLRGLHYQIRQPQGKLVRCIAGSVYDVVVDLRRSSPRFGDWAAVQLTAENKRMVWVPPGFAHGFLVTSAVAEVVYKATDFWGPAFERTLAWDDPALAIPWPLNGPPVLSAKDSKGATLPIAETYE
jgi:dTDP-4-dehydrorhamnose 3,5-epimerase